MSTVGVKPPGGCHFPAAVYAEFARLLHPMMQYHLYHRYVDSFNPPNLKRAYFTSTQHDELVLEFDYHITWSDALVSQFHLNGEPKQVVAGSANGGRITLKLKGPTKSKTVTYLDSANWNPDNLSTAKTASRRSHSAMCRLSHLTPIVEPKRSGTLSMTTSQTK